MTTAHWRGSRGEGRRLLDSSVFVENFIALVAATLVLAVFLCLAAVDPATWTFQSNEASHIRAELWHCLKIEGKDARLECYDELGRQPPPHPARGANPPLGAFRK